MNTIESFTFIVLTYNHSPYIIEHLESVKYLIDSYGYGIAIDIIIADDASQDDTVTLANAWLNTNTQLFNKTILLSDNINRGTCKNLTNALKNLSTKYCKITAGDDVYSFENIFSEVKNIDNNHILSGLPLNLIDGVVLPTSFDLFNHFATNAIYKKKNYLTRLKRVNFSNSPNIVYDVDILLDKNITTFVDKFYVTEDWPMQIKAAEVYGLLRYVQMEKTFVYYRRTNNSAYIIKGSAFSRDRSEIFRYLISNETNVFEKMLLRNRLFCFNVKNRIIKRIINISIYVYGLCLLKNIVLILRRYSKYDRKLSKHQIHYDYVASRARDFSCARE